MTPAVGVGWLPTVAAAARFEFRMQVRGWRCGSCSLA